MVCNGVWCIGWRGDWQRSSLKYSRQPQIPVVLDNPPKKKIMKTLQTKMELHQSKHQTRK